MSGDWRVDVPEGRSGPWQVERFTVDAATSARWAGTRYVQLVRHQPVYEWPPYSVPPGRYTRLVRHDPLAGGVFTRRVTVMSDTPGECADHLAFVEQARAHGGRVLIGGLGLGAVLDAVLCDDSPVTEAVVLEQSGDVIALVGPHYVKRYGPRVTLIRADVLTTRPSDLPLDLRRVRFMAAWWDIWDDISPQHLPEMAHIQARWQTRVDWQACWGAGVAEQIAAAGWQAGRAGDIAVTVEPSGAMR